MAILLLMVGPDGALDLAGTVGRPEYGSMKRTTVFILTAMILLATGCGWGGPPAPPFDIRLAGPRAEGDAIKVALKGEEIVFSVDSEFGIGRAVITPEEGNWPEKIVFQMNLSGLESFVVDGQQVYRTERRDDHRKGGYRINLPAGVTGSNRDPIEINWIDFYRN